MGPVLAVFVVTVGVIMGVYLLDRPEVAVRAHLTRRLARSARGPATRPAAQLLRAEERVRAWPLLDRLLGSSTGLARPLREALVLSDLPISAGALAFGMACCGVASLGLVQVLLGVWWLALLAGGFGAWAPLMYVRWAGRKRLLTLEEQFPQAVELIARALRAGHALTTALGMVTEEAPPEIAAEFKQLYDRQSFGMPLSEALREFAHRIPLLDAKFFVTAVLTQRESGGNLSEVLDNLASVIRDRFKVKRQVRVVTAHARMTASILVLLPPGIALAMMVSNPGHLDSLVSDPLGRYLLAIGIALQIAGTLIVRRLVRLEY
jgi:tight adherence protein B